MTIAVLIGAATIWFALAQQDQAELERSSDRLERQKIQTTLDYAKSKIDDLSARLKPSTATPKQTADDRQTASQVRRLLASVQAGLNRQQQAENAREEQENASRKVVDGGSTFNVDPAENMFLTVTASPNGIPTKILLPAKPRRGQWVSIENSSGMIALEDAVRENDPLRPTTIYVSGNGKRIRGIASSEMPLKDAGDFTFHFVGSEWKVEDNSQRRN